MLSKKDRKLKSVYVDHGFQFYFLTWILFVSIVNSLILVFIYKYAISSVIEYGRSLGFQPDSIYFTAVTKHSEIMSSIFGIGCFLIFAFTLGCGFALSHRIAGPLKRLGKHMEKFATGEIDQEIRFRKKDYFPELANQFNQVVKSKRSKDKKSA